MSKPLESLLVSCISPGGRPKRITLEYIERLRAAGATVLLSEGATDVSLARCLQAETILRWFNKADKLLHVLWLDDDVATSIECTQALLQLCILANRTRLCSVSGAYVNRHRVAYQTHQELAACVLRHDYPMIPIDLIVSWPATTSEPSKVALRPDLVSWPETGQELKVVLRPALTGLGCLLQPREVFLAHCAESPSFAYGPLMRLVPHVCHSRLISIDELRSFVVIPDNAHQLFWHGEDFDYCSREFKHGRAVFLAPIDFAHEARTVLLPNNETVLPGLRQEDA